MVLDLSAGGRLTVSPFVNDRKVEAMTEMVAASRLGGYAGERARTDLKETLATTDGPHSFAHLVNLRNLPLSDEYIPDYDPIVQDEIVPDFEPIRFFALRTNWDGLEYGKDTDGVKGIAPHVSELDTYQYAFGYTQKETSLAVEKRGFKVGWSLERGKNDTFGLVNRFPNDMLRVGQKTEEYVVARALTQGVTAASQMTGGVDPISEKTIPANAPLTGEALRVALREITQRVDDEGNRVPLPARFRLVVGIGEGGDAQLAIAKARGLVRIQDGLLTYDASNLPGDTLGRIAGVIETEWIEPGHWYLVPEKGTTDMPALVRVKLAGYTAPEVYVSNFNGTPLAGGASNSPFQAYSFDNDAVDLKYRQFVNAAIFSEEAIIWSDGTGQ